MRVHHLALRFGGPEQNVKSFGGTPEVAFVSLRQPPDDVDHLRADIKPVTGLWINHAFQSLIGKLHRDLILVVLTRSPTGLNGAVLRERINVHKGRAGLAALLDHQFKEKAETTVEIFFRGFSLQTIKCVPLLLQRAGTAHFQNFRRQGKCTVRMRMGVDPAACLHNGGLNHVADGTCLFVCHVSHDSFSRFVSLKKPFC